MFEIINNIAQTIITALITLSISSLAVFGITYTNTQKTQAIDSKSVWTERKNNKTNEIAVNNPLGQTMEDATETPIEIKETQETTSQKQIDPLENIMRSLKNAIVTTKPETVSEELNTQARAALVNIMCTTKSGGLLNPISGSGIIIDPEGIIITNAHIGQYFLLKDYPTENFIDCFIRTSSPATPAYNAELLYISASWIQQNAKTITQQNPEGTGENDFALLRIISSRNTKSLPAEFQYIKPNTTENLTTLGAPVLLAGYPAGFLSGEAIQKELWQVTTITEIVELFTFTTREIDLFSLGSNLVAQKGSSGGGVIHIPDEKLIGIVVTSTEADTTDDRILNAIAIAHINRRLFEETGFTLANILSSDLARQATTFQKTIAPTLTGLLVNELEK